MKWLNIYLQWPWQQKWVQQLQGERWRTGLDEGLNTKQLDFFTDSYWVIFFRLVVVVVWEVTFWTWMRGVRGLKPCLSATSSAASSSCSWRRLVSHHIYYTAIYPQLQYQRVVVGVVVVVVQLVIIQLVPMAKTQLVTIGGRSCWVIADTSISRRLELDFQF